MHNHSNSPLNYNRLSTHSPQKLSTSVNLVERYKSRLKISELSPSNQNQNGYTVHHEEKLKVSYIIYYRFMSNLSQRLCRSSSLMLHLSIKSKWKSKDSPPTTKSIVMIMFFIKTLLVRKFSPKDVSM